MSATLLITALQNLERIGVTPLEETCVRSVERLIDGRAQGVERRECFRPANQVPRRGPDVAGADIDSQVEGRGRLAAPAPVCGGASRRGLFGVRYWAPAELTAANRSPTHGCKVVP